MEGPDRQAGAHCEALDEGVFVAAFKSEDLLGFLVDPRHRVLKVLPETKTFYRNNHPPQLCDTLHPEWTGGKWRSRPDCHPACLCEPDRKSTLHFKLASKH